QFGLPIRPVVIPPRSWLEATKVFNVLRMLTRDPDPQKRSAVAPTLSDHEMAILKGMEPVWSDSNRNLQTTIEHLYGNHVTLFEESYCDEGVAFNSGPFDGLPTA